MRLTLPALALSGLLLAGPAPAAEDLPTGPWREGSPRAETTAAPTGPAAPAKKTAAPWYGRNNVHKYLGLGSIGAAALTVISPKKEGGAHERFAQAAAFLGGAAVASGFYAHGEDVRWDWNDPDTRHATYGALGALGFALAVAQGGKGGHAAYGSLGAVSMLAAIKITW
jgi:hypothetical protein